jgi:hypothetical protein
MSQPITLRRAWGELACASVAATALVAAALLLPTTAKAAEVWVAQGELSFSGTAGEKNDLTLEPADGYIDVSDPGVTINPGSGCKEVVVVGIPGSTRSYRCTGATAGVRIDLGDGDDRLSLEASTRVPVTARGGPGDDALSVGDEPDYLYGDSGDDQLFAGGGADTVIGGEGADYLVGDHSPYMVDGHLYQPAQSSDGNDLLDGGAGDDQIDPGRGDDRVRGGDGRDRIDYGGRDEAVELRLDRSATSGQAGERDELLDAFERSRTGQGEDSVLGGAGGEEIETGPGADRVDGGSGQDIVISGAGSDSIETADAAEDRVDCGGGTDSAHADAVDVVTGCEALETPAAVAPKPARPRIRARASRHKDLVVIQGRIVLPSSSSCVGGRVRVTARGWRRSYTARPSGCSFRMRLALGSTHRSEKLKLQKLKLRYKDSSFELTAVVRVRRRKA